MNIEVFLNASMPENINLKGKVAVVIDAFRATSVIVEGISNGAKEFIPVQTVQEALDFKSLNPDVLLGGERDGLLIAGFDLDNSPLNYTKEAVDGKTIVITTTNGTRALKAAESADKVLVASFRNLSSVAHELLKYPEVVIICSGSENRVSLEDSTCAGGLIYYLELYTSVDCSDLSFMLTSLYRTSGNLKEYLSNGEHYRYLANLGMQADLDFCIALNKTSIVPIYDGVAITK